jgi:hypothetical protein
MCTADRAQQVTSGWPTVRQREFGRLIGVIARCDSRSSAAGAGRIIVAIDRLVTTGNDSTATIVRFLHHSDSN